MPELVILSGKGGTGKTTMAAALAVLAPQPVICDTDVDAANLHLLLKPQVLETTQVLGGKKARIQPEACTACGLCREHCRFQAISPEFQVDPFACEGCGVCVRLCPAEAIAFVPEPVGEYYRSQTPYGPLIHARLYLGGENSGKIVTLVRRAAQETAQQEHRDLILVDGPPGLGCPVIASLTGATHVLLLAEPSVSSRHDLDRVLDLIRSFKLPAAVVLNKWNLNEAQARSLAETCARWELPVLGRLPWSPAVLAANRAGQPLPLMAVGDLAATLRDLWLQVSRFLDLPSTSNRQG